MAQGIFGIVLVVAAYVVSMGLVFWSRHIVEKIRARRLRTPRQIRKGARDGQ
jgi:hypothetical protein